MGICVDTLRKWLKASGIKAGSADRENRQVRRRELRKQLAEKDEVIDVLKKSVGLLSKP